MATYGKEEEESFLKEQSSDTLVPDDIPSLAGYVHNPEEFIDIHGAHRQQRVCSSGTADSINSEEARTVNTGEKDLHVPVTNKDNEFVNFLARQHVTKNLKLPVQVSEESDLNENCDMVPKCNDDDSDDEYQSADDGDGNDNHNDNDEDDTEDEFIPVGDEDDYRDNEDNSIPFCNNDNSDENESGVKESAEQEAESNIIDDMEIRKSMEEKLTEEEKQARKEMGQKLKDDGNEKFRSGNYDEAIRAYTEALDICPLNFLKERSIMFANRAACKMKKELYEGAIEDSTRALDLHPHYLKALQRRADLYEKTEKLDEALKDYQKLVELDPSQVMARAACMRLAEQIKDRNEKMKEEMIGKLKDLGNLVLRPFGLSVNNFNLQQDPKTGSYSVQFQQNPPSNGS